MSHKILPAKWLRTMFYVQIGMVAATCLSWLPIQDLWITWLKRILNLVTVFCLYRLSPMNKHYRKATIFQGICIAGVLLTSLPLRASAIVLAVSICSIFGAYQEYHGHAQLIAEQDAVLSKKWSRFFGWALLVEVLMSVASSILSVTAAFMGFDISGILDTLIITISLPRLIINAVYLIYLNKTIYLLQNEGDMYG